MGAQVLSKVTAIRTFLQSLVGWRRLVACFLLGAITAFAQAPYFFLPLLFIGYTGLVWVLDASENASHKWKSFFSACWAFAFGYFYLGLYWMAFSFFHNATSTPHLIMLMTMGFVGVAGLTAFIGLFYGAAGAVMARFWQLHWVRIVLFALIWSLTEYVRGHVLTGLPWNLTGQAWVGYIALAQSSAIWGPYFLSFLAILTSVLPVLIVENFEEKRSLKKHVPLFSLLGIYTALFAYGWIALSGSPTTYNDKIIVQIVQPNIPQKDKINPDLFSDNFLAAFNLTGGEEVSGLTPEQELISIWPENAAYTYFQRQPETLGMINDALPPSATLLAGAARMDKGLFFNSLLVIEQTDVKTEEEKKLLTELGMETRRRAITNFYDKHHLAPFGEFVPFAGVLKAIGVDKFIPINNAWTRGTGPAVVTLKNTTVAPVICFETIFPGRIFPKGERPDWIVSVTNDAWFNDSVGPKQHLAQIQLRAIETGLPLVRSANTGISALIDAKGRLLTSIPLSERGTIVSALPEKVSNTIYNSWGDRIYFLITMLMLLSIGVFLRFEHTK